jgi:hypothetical protein
VPKVRPRGRSKAGAAAQGKAENPFLYLFLTGWRHRTSLVSAFLFVSFPFPFFHCSSVSSFSFPFFFLFPSVLFLSFPFLSVFLGFARRSLEWAPFIGRNAFPGCCSGKRCEAAGATQGAAAQPFDFFFISLPSWLSRRSNLT